MFVRAPLVTLGTVDTLAFALLRGYSMVVFPVLLPDSCLSGLSPPISQRPPWSVFVRRDSSGESSGLH